MKKHDKSSNELSFITCITRPNSGITTKKDETPTKNLAPAEMEQLRYSARARQTYARLPRPLISNIKNHSEVTQEDVKEGRYRYE